MQMEMGYRYSDAWGMWYGCRGNVYAAIMEHGCVLFDEGGAAVPWDEDETVWFAEADAPAEIQRRLEPCYPAPINRLVPFDDKAKMLNDAE
jgi:hypothetical protein